MIIEREVGQIEFHFDDDNHEFIFIGDKKKPKHNVVLTTQEMITISQIFWKSWSIARVKSDVCPKKFPEIERKISKIAEKLSYW